ncbi:polysaccharide biosynthesis/export family protein [Algoriphagus sp.]|uniref:polysaccharide biosynthesis/export family protein n=1 Tax=Algoriphagus sp. TaxID=1872435 RepID=UPI003F6EEDB3
MKITSFINVFLVVAILGLGSCAKRNLTYFSDIGPDSNMTLISPAFEEPKIVPGDLLDIKVSTLNPETNVLFNYGVLSAERRGDAQVSQDPNVRGYLVDNKGFIEFPTLGLIHIEGLNKEEIKLLLKEKMASMVKDPKIEIRFLNFKVTVIGEVNRPSTFTVPTERITILEALGLAGDMTAFALRENVLLIRETPEGKALHRFNIGNKEVLTSPFYYLKQNDVIYVEADKKKLSQANVNPNTVTALSILSSLVVALIFNYNQIFR